MMDTHASVVPGLSQQQLEVLKLIMREAVSEALEEWTLSPKCPRQCEDMAVVRADIHEIAGALHGDGETEGIVGRVLVLENKMRLVLWLAAAATVCAIGTLGTLITTILTNHLRP